MPERRRRALAVVGRFRSDQTDVPEQHDEYLAGICTDNCLEMTIYFDISAAVHRRAGLGRYAESLARALLPLLGDELAFFYNREAGIEPLAGLEGVPAATVNLGYKPWRMLVWLAQVGRVGFNRRVPGATLFHATEHLLLPLRETPTVLTVHDLIFRRYPAHHKRLNRWYLNTSMPLFCRRAGHIIAVSEQSKRDVIEAYGISPDKITVIYEAADPRFCPQPVEVVADVRARYGLPAALSAVRRHHRAAQEPGPPPVRVRAAARRGPDRRAGDRRSSAVGCTTISSLGWRDRRQKRL